MKPTHVDYSRVIVRAPGRSTGWDDSTVSAVHPVKIAVREESLAKQRRLQNAARCQLTNRTIRLPPAVRTRAGVVFRADPVAHAFVRALPRGRYGAEAHHNHAAQKPSTGDHVGDHVSGRKPIP